MLVPQGQSVGGDFHHIPACRSPRQFGCVVAYSTFDGPVPPDSLYGRSTTPGDEVLCTDPAALGRRHGAAPVDLSRPRPFAPGTTIGLAIPLIGIPPLNGSPRPGCQRPVVYDSQCVNADGADVMQISPLGGAPCSTPCPTAQWGLHLTRREHRPGQPRPARAAPVPGLRTQERGQIDFSAWRRACPSRDRPWMMRTYAGHSTAKTVQRALPRATSPRARRACRSRSTCRRRPATTPTTSSPAARSARSACPIAHRGDMARAARRHPARRR